MKLNTVCVALLLAAAPLAGMAQVSVNIQLPGLVTIAPPEPRFERVPPPRAGHVWVPGHWQWRRDAYVWRPGYWQQARADQRFAPGRWVRADGGWRWVEPSWHPHAHRRGERHSHDDRRHDRRDRHDRHGHGDGRRGEHFCPPGQAKKGNC